ncbi:hypothetical protein JYU34_016728 [Plutella xylostella]|uniref:Sulfatase-modifying factor enzyme-like domain-containing protein n=1 Tax=Plutella xylostella TaxID=51655 RepID=A0ABQ7Q3C4_PLUXY|nr:hypothetical protein JYU34_016728 [Plutella xylostella]
MYPNILYLFVLFHINQAVIADSGCGCGANRDDNEKKSFVSSIVNEESCSLGNKLKDEATNKILNDKMVLVPSGEYQVGTDDVILEADNEGPKRLVKLESFYLDQFEVSNRNFAQFVEATHYKTEAEFFGDSFVFSLFLNNTFKEQLRDFRVAQVPWWYKVTGSNWRHPHGPDSDIIDMMDHPVTHISWNDAKAYCTWREARLPTEAEWEAACRGGHRGTTYPWGDKLFPDRKYMANIWQGTFPSHDSAKDGFIGTCPVDEFLQNDFNLYNIVGNVWEWVEDSWSDKTPKEKVKKGGSYLCHSSYCFRYRCSARFHNTEDSSAGNLGFRCAKTA